jgi:hypothetical protein
VNPVIFTSFITKQKNKRETAVCGGAGSINPSPPCLVVVVAARAQRRAEGILVLRQALNHRFVALQVAI